jgi:hypothetical protein
MNAGVTAADSTTMQKGARVVSKSLRARFQGTGTAGHPGRASGRTEPITGVAAVQRHAPTVANGTVGTHASEQPAVLRVGLWIERLADPTTTETDSAVREETRGHDGRVVAGKTDADVGSPNGVCGAGDAPARRAGATGGARATGRADEPRRRRRARRERAKEHRDRRRLHPSLFSPAKWSRLSRNSRLNEVSDP